MKYRIVKRRVFGGKFISGTEVSMAQFTIVAEVKLDTTNKRQNDGLKHFRESVVQHPFLFYS